MKKLTATIFATLLTVVSVNAANAEIASKGYVDEEVGKVNTALEGKVDDAEISDMLTKTEAGSTYATKSEISDMETKSNASATYATKESLNLKQNVANLVNSAGYGAAKTDDTKYPSVKAVADAITEATKDIASSETVSQLQGDVEGLKTSKADKSTTLAGYGITDAYTKSESDGKYATAAQGALADTALQKQGELTQGNLLTTDESGKIIDAGKKGALASKDTVSGAEIDAGAVSKDKLDSGVQASLGKADTAVQPAAISDMLTKTVASSTYETKENATATYATKTELGNKADKSALTAKQDVANLVNSAGYGAAKTDDTKYPSVKAVADAITEATKGIASDETVSALEGRVETAEGEIDTLQSDVSANKTAIGTVGSLTTEEKTNLVGAINEVDKNADAAKTAADAAQSAADTAQDAADAAQSTADQAKATADKAIPAPTPECTNLGAKCVLVVGNSGYEWEVIQRGTAEGQP